MIVVASTKIVPRIRSGFDDNLLISSSRRSSVGVAGSSQLFLDAEVVPGSGLFLIQNNFNQNYSELQDYVFSARNFLPNYNSPSVYSLKDTWGEILVSSSAAQGFDLSLGTNDFGALSIATAVASNCPEETVFVVFGDTNSCLTSTQKTWLRGAIPNLWVVTVEQYMRLFSLRVNNQN